MIDSYHHLLKKKERRLKKRFFFFGARFSNYDVQHVVRTNVVIQCIDDDTVVDVVFDDDDERIKFSHK